MTTVRKKPNKEVKTADFIEQAGSNLAQGEATKSKVKKSQIPVIIPALLLSELDAHIEATMTGISRSSWICQAIKEKMDRDKS